MCPSPFSCIVGLSFGRHHPTGAHCGVQHCTGIAIRHPLPACQRIGVAIRDPRPSPCIGGAIRQPPCSTAGPPIQHPPSFTQLPRAWSLSAPAPRSAGAATQRVCLLCCEAPRGPGFPSVGVPGRAFPSADRPALAIAAGAMVRPDPSACTSGLARSRFRIPARPKWPPSSLAQACMQLFDGLLFAARCSISGDPPASSPSPAHGPSNQFRRPAPPAMQTARWGPIALQPNGCFRPQCWRVSRAAARAHSPRHSPVPAQPIARTLGSRRH